MFATKEKEEDILEEAGIPGDYINFFRTYQKDGKNLGVWHREKNGRFTMNFQHYILEGMEKGIDSDLMLAAAILLSHCELYFNYVADPKTKNWDGYKFETEKIRETTRAVAQYMAKVGEEAYGFPIGNSSFNQARSLLGFTNQELKVPLADITITPGRYLRFFCALPEIWGYQPKD